MTFKYNPLKYNYCNKNGQVTFFSNRTRIYSKKIAT